MLKRSVDVHPEVYEEVEESRSWYEGRAENLGIDFLDEVSRAIETIRESPATWPWHDKKLGLRRFLVHRFPFAIIYRSSRDSIQILAIMHLHRHPDYWKHRIPFFSEK